MWRSWCMCLAVCALMVIPVERELLGRQSSPSSASKIVCDPDNSGLTLPDGFCGPDGSLYVSDSVKGRIWRIVAKTTARPSSGQ